MRSRFGLAVATVVAVLVVGCGGRQARTTGHIASARLTTPGTVSGARVLSGTPFQVTSALGSVWVLTCERNCSGRGLHSSGQLVRVSESTGRIVQRIDVVDPTAFAIGGGAIWLTHFNMGSVSRVDPRTEHTTQTVSLTLPTPIVPGDRQFLPVNIGAGEGSVWVSTARGWLAQINPSSSRVVRMVRAPSDVTGQVVVGAHGTWVAENSLGVGLIQPNGHRLQIRPIPDASGRPLAVDQLEIGGGLVWTYGQTTDTSGPNGAPVLTNGAFITTLDERTGRIVRQLRFPVGPYEIAYGNGALFVADYDNGRLFRIDPGYRIHPLPRVPGPGTLIAVTPGAIWATTKSGLLRRIAIPNTVATNPTWPRAAPPPPRPAIPGKVVSQINLQPPSGGRPAEGIAWIYKVAGGYDIAISASGLKPITLKSGYGVWLAHGPNSVRMLGFVSHGYAPNGTLLEFAPNGRLVVEAGLPADAGRYHQLLITIETHPHVKHPGLVVLEAPFGL